MISYTLSELTINNFRVFEEKNRFSFAPITILTGTNSSGKSSLTKALKLLASSFKENGLRSLYLMDPDLKIGSFKSVLNSRLEKGDIDFVLKINGSFSKSVSDFIIFLKYNEQGLLEFGISDPDGMLFSQKGNFSNNTLIGSFIRLPKSILKKSKLKSLFPELDSNSFKLICSEIVKHLEIESSAHLTGSYTSIKSGDIINERFDEAINGLKSIGKKNKVEYFDSESNQMEEADLVININPQLADVLSNELKALISYDALNTYLIDILDLDAIKNLNLFPKNLFSSFFSEFDFIDSIRANQEMIYTKANAPSFYAILESYYYHRNHNDGEFLKRWIVDEFKLVRCDRVKSIDDVLIIEQIDGYGYTVRLNSEGSFTDLSKLGYGVAQLLPILIKVSLNPGKIFVIEEPESNLHPALQSRLADFFVAAAKRSFHSLKNDSQFIIETHSEYLIRKLQYLTASPKFDLSPQETIIYYFYHPLNIPIGERQVNQITIQNDGGLSEDFGTGFFDETDNIAISLWNLNKVKSN